MILVITQSFSTPIVISNYNLVLKLYNVISTPIKKHKDNGNGLVFIFMARSRSRMESNGPPAEAQVHSKPGR